MLPIRWGLAWAMVVPLALGSAQALTASEPSVSPAEAEGGMHVWKDRSGSFSVEAEYVGSDGNQVRLRRTTGEEIRVPLEKLSEADRQYVSRRRQSPTVAGPTTEVVAEGVGVDPDKALQNAFSRAIEQAVGVLVSATTRVENDELIRDEVLTFSRGYVEDYEVVKKWQEDGLHHAQIRAEVALSKLAETLREKHIAVAPLPGEKMTLQGKTDVINAENAAEIFAQAMAGFRLDRLLSVKLFGEPETVASDATHRTLRVRVRLAPDDEKWNAFAEPLREVLQRLASKRSDCSFELARFRRRLTSPPQDQIETRLGGPGMLVSVFSTMNTSGTRITWTAYRVPETLLAMVEDVQCRRYRLVIDMLDGAGAVAHRTVHPKLVIDDDPQRQRHPVGNAFFVVGANRTLLDTMSIYPKQTSEVWIAPVGYRVSGGNLTDGIWQPFVEFEDEITLPFEELQKVVKYAAYLEPVPEGEEPEDNRGRLPSSRRTPSRSRGGRP